MTIHIGGRGPVRRGRPRAVNTNTQALKFNVASNSQYVTILGL